MSELGVSRRNLICGLVAAGVTGPLVVACGSSEPSSSAGPAGGGATTPAGGSTGVIQKSEIPVGGGKIFPSEGFVVTQPTAGEFKAFSSSCTHQGTTLSAITDGRMICPKHGSQFSLEGAVEQGPASVPLPEKTVTVKGSTLTVT